MQQSNTRIAWIDALRGFTILLVVFGHVNNSIGFESYESNVASFFSAFRMPMFFFISGFVAYKKQEIYTASYVVPQFLKKLRVQLVPMFVFFFVYSIWHNGGVPRFWITGFDKYWFTFVLFEMLAIYYLISFVSKKLSRDLLWLLILLSLFGIFALAFLNRDFPGYRLLCLENLFKYLQFFTLGLYCRKNQEKFAILLNNEIFKVSAFCLFIGSYLLCCHSDLLSSFVGGGYVIHFIRDIVIRYTGLFSVLVIFSAHSEFFSSEKKLPKQMRYVGRRTLDIYLIHYFMIPNLSGLYMYFSGNANMFIQMLMCISLALLIVMFCIIVSNSLRSSNFISHWLFGQEYSVK